MQVLSFSQLQAFWACPRLHYYRYQLQVPSPQSEAQETREGVWIHEQLHLAYLGRDCELAQRPEWARLWQRYQAEIAPFAQAGSWSEWDCHVPLNHFQPPLWLTGRLDRIYLQQQTLTLLDWKTSHRGPNASTQLQLDFYAWLLWQARSLLAKQPLQKIRARAVWLNLPDTALEREFEAADIPALGARFQDLLDPLQQEAPPSLPQPRSADGRLWCTMCEYQPLCPEGKYHA